MVPNSHTQYSNVKYLEYNKMSLILNTFMIYCMIQKALQALSRSCLWHIFFFLTVRCRELNYSGSIVHDMLLTLCYKKGLFCFIYLVPFMPLPVSHSVLPPQQPFHLFNAFLFVCTSCYKNVSLLHLF